MYGEDTRGLERDESYVKILTYSSCCNNQIEKSNSVQLIMRSQKIDLTSLSGGRKLFTKSILVHQFWRQSLAVFSTA